MELGKNISSLIDLFLSSCLSVCLSCLSLLCKIIIIDVCCAAHVRREEELPDQPMSLFDHHIFTRYPVIFKPVLKKLVNEWFVLKSVCVIRIFFFPHSIILQITNITVGLYCIMDQNKKMFHSMCSLQNDMTKNPNSQFLIIPFPLKKIEFFCFAHSFWFTGKKEKEKNRMRNIY